VTGRPHVSVVIPAYYSDETIADCLQSLRDQRFQDFETIVVNSSPEERTRRIVEQFEEVRFEQSEGRLLPHAARNRGVSQARGELLVFTDPDCRARPDWLERMVRAHEDGHALVCGAIELNGAGWFEQGVHLCKYSWRLSGLPGGPSWVGGTANASCTRAVWESVGPFDGERYAGDALFSWRAAEKGWPPWFEPGAVVEHRYIGSAISLWRERLERGDDFAMARTMFEQWRRGRAALYLLAGPLLPGVVLVRNAGDAIEAGWLRPFLLTLPLQFLGHVAWSIGEARAHWRVLTARSG
jgi:GT2 family glycosyltransferase